MAEKKQQAYVPRNSGTSDLVDPVESSAGTTHQTNPGSQEGLRQLDSWPELTITRPT